MVTTRSYDKLNRLLGQRSDFAGQVTPVFSTGYDYNDANQRVRKYEPDGSYWVYAYDNLGQVTSGKRYWADGSLVAGQQFEYAFDDIGNRSSAKSGGDANGLNLRTTSYSVNLLNQYSSRNSPSSVDIIGAAAPSATVTVNSGATVRKGEYFWKDLAVSNGSGPASTSVSIAASSGGSSTGKLLWPAAAEIPTYDDDGNLTSDSLWTYTWNAENQLVRMESRTTLAIPDRRRVDFYYDWMGRRIQKETKTWDTLASDYASSGTVLKFIYDGWNVVSELDGFNNQLRVYLWGPDFSGSFTGAGGVGGLLSMFDIATYKYQFYAYDGNGNVGAMINQDGAFTARYEYGPFGELVRSSGSLAALNPFRFSTKFQDDESGYLYYGYRYYDPRNGRWISRDPIEEFGGLNIAAFIGNSTPGRIDVLGLAEPRQIGGIKGPDNILVLDSSFSGKKDIQSYSLDNAYATLWKVADGSKIKIVGKCTNPEEVSVTPTGVSAQIGDFVLEAYYRGKLLTTKKITTVRPKKATRSLPVKGTIKIFIIRVVHRINIYDQFNRPLLHAPVKEQIRTILNVNIAALGKAETAKANTEELGYISDVHSFTASYVDGTTRRQFGQKLIIGDWVSNEWQATTYAVGEEDNLPYMEGDEEVEFH